MEEENKINEAQISFSEEEKTSAETETFFEEAVSEEKKKRDFYVEMVLFLVLGVLMGVAIKNEAVKRITMGYDDYRMSIKSADYDINKLQADLVRKSIEESAKQQQQQGEPTEGAAIPQGDN